MKTASAQDDSMFTIEVTPDNQKVIDLLFQEQQHLGNTLINATSIKKIQVDPQKIIIVGSLLDGHVFADTLTALVEAKKKGSHITEKTIRQAAVSAAANSPAVQAISKVIPAPGPERFRPLEKEKLSNQFTTAANENTPKLKDRSTEKQKQLGALIDKNILTFAVGPAGTGKTHVAVTKAVEGFKNGEYKKILICRPAVATEKIGFLPGTENDKLAPYMRPIYDIVDALLGPGKYKEMLEKEILEIAPFGTMMGRTFGGEDNKWFVIIDEAQNATVDQLKTAISRMGEGSKMVITGDPLQISLPYKGDSGLMPFYELLKGQEGIDGLEFDTTEVMRSKLVKTLTAALDKNSDFQKKPGI